MIRLKYIFVFSSLTVILIVFFLFTNCKSDDSAIYKYPDANVILILIDTLRADHLGCYGYSRNTSPEIDKLAKEGIIFKNMLAQTSWTRPGTASILSGLYPRNHGANTKNDILSEEINLLPEILKEYGYTSFAFVGNIRVTPVTGFNQGYEDFFSFPDLKLPIQSDVMTDYLIKFLKQLNKTTNNFIYIHYMDPHTPYIPKEKYFSESNKKIFKIDFFQSGMIHEMSADEQHSALKEMINAYDDEILYNDKMIGKLVHVLKKKNMYSNSIIIVTSDHGEEFFEHGDLQHGRTLYKEQLRIPLIFRLPDGIRHKINKIANQVDISPTILSLLQIPTPDYFDGIELLNKKNKDMRYSFAELNLERNILSSIQTLKDKLIECVSLPVEERGKRWFKAKAVIETDNDSIELIIRSFQKDRTLQILSDGNPLDEFIITKEKKKFTITLLKSSGKKIVTIKSLTPCQVPKYLGIGQDTRCLAFCIFDSKNVNANNILGEIHKEYYVLKDDLKEKNDQYDQNKFKKTIMDLEKRLEKLKLKQILMQPNKKPIEFNNEQLKALKALGYI